jgi:antitoxin CptB
MDQTALNRLRWRCRRGMLENDLILTRFLDRRGFSITDAELEALRSVLQLNDNDLWELLSGRQEPADRTVMPLLEQLRDPWDAPDMTHRDNECRREIEP